MSGKMGPLYARQDYAGFIRRTLALGIDFLLGCIVMTAVVWAWYWLAPASWWTQKVYAWLYVSLLLAWWLYMIGMRLSMNGTLGYRIMRIRYAYMLDEPLTWLTVLYRSIAATAMMMVFVVIDHLWILGDQRKQAWHDKLTGFYVVKKHAVPVGRIPVIRRVATVMGLTFIFWEPAQDDTPPPLAKGLAPAPPVRVLNDEPA